jgi:DNA-3-methyladenine glycosylase
MFNIITNKEGIPDAVLIRAIWPVTGIDVMLKRRRKAQPDLSLTSGPGSLSQALGIGLRHNGISVLDDEIWLESGIRVKPSQIIAGPRIGVDYAGADARRLWRFRLRNGEWVRRARCS